MFFKDFVSVKRQKIKRGASQTYDTPSSFWFYKNKSFFGMFAIYFFLSFSKKAIVSLEKPCPFQVDVFVMRIQHWLSGYFKTMADVPASEPVRIHGLLLFGV